MRAAPCSARWCRDQMDKGDWSQPQLDVLCAASSRASARGNPIMTPPSAIASRNMQAKAGPDPDRAVQASKCFSSRKRHRPIEENIFRMISLFNPSASEGGRFETTVMPSRICQASYTLTGAALQNERERTRHGVLGIARMTVVSGRTHSESCAMVTPARMLMSNFPARASLTPFSLRMRCATCGLQLEGHGRRPKKKKTAAISPKCVPPPPLSHAPE